nr:hypothetical protein [Mixta theicola]
MRLFNPVTMTEVILGIHDTTDSIELPDDNCFFTMTEIPEDKVLSVNHNGEPILVDNN